MTREASAKAATVDVREAEPGAGIPITSLPNLRDLGGWSTGGGGRVRRGLLYRSTGLDQLQGADLEAFAALGIRSVYDLRTEAERTAQPDRVPPGTEVVVCDVLAGLTTAAPAEVWQAMADPASAPDFYRDGRPQALFEDAYRQIVGLPSALDAYRRLFADLGEADHRPALFHCVTGKDRTGWAAAAMLSLLGVSRDDVFRDYLLTNDQLLPSLKPVFERFAAAGGDPDLLYPVMGVQRGYLEIAFDEMELRFGTIEGYFEAGLGIDAAGQQALRAAFTEGPAA